MTRGLGATALTAANGEVVLRTSAVELLFASQTVRLNGAAEPLVIGGNTFDGVGLLGGISTVQEAGDLASSGISLTLAGVPRDLVSVTLNEQYQGRPATVYEVFLDPATYAVIEAPIIFRGRMDQMNIALGETATIELTLEDRLTDMDRPKLRRYTDEDQKRAFPTDRGFEFVASTVEKEIIWPARSFRG